MHQNHALFPNRASKLRGAGLVLVRVPVVAVAAQKVALGDLGVEQVVAHFLLLLELLPPACGASAKGLSATCCC